jgi:copper resistance protein D
VLAASVWVGGSIILIFVVIPYARTLSGETRAQALREVGRGWRLLGWGAMAVAVVSGLQLAIADNAFDGAERDFDLVLVAKIAAVGLLVAGAAVHDFVLGPRLARQIREGRQPTIRRPLVVVGWITFVLTVTVPTLGAVLSHLS